MRLFEEASRPPRCSSSPKEKQQLLFESAPQMAVDPSSAAHSKGCPNVARYHLAIMRLLEETSRQLKVSSSPVEKKQLLVDFAPQMAVDPPSAAPTKGGPNVLLDSIW